MESNNNLVYIITIIVAILSLVGNSLQYLFPTRKTKRDSEFDMAKTLDSVTEAYDKLFNKLNERIIVLEAEIMKCSEMRDKMEKRVKIQDEELARLNAMLTVLHKDNVLILDKSSE